MEPLDALIRESLVELASFIATKRWHGREREAVSLYVLGFLISKCRPNGPLIHPTQVGVDVAVLQQPGPQRKKVVCKDVVIWPDEAGTCWDDSGQPTRHPLAILEWKARTEKSSDYDEKWLRDFSMNLPNFVGYAISLNPDREHTSMTVTRVKNGLATPCWLLFPV